jgi:PBP1b-binding outer membrane lipoprotein LpoB
MRNTLLLISALLLMGCASQRKQLEQAATYEREGMLAEAHQRYQQVYERKRGNVNAHVGMKRTAQAMLERLMQEASGWYLVNDLATGDRKRQDALNHKQVMDRKGLALQWDNTVDQRRMEAQVHEAQLLYQQAEAAYRNDRFTEAEDLAARAFRLDPAHKEAEYLLKIAQLEPRYRQGLRARELGLWRDAYLQFKWVTDRDAGYRDAWQLQDEMRRTAQVTLAYVPIFNQAVYNGGIQLTNQGVLEAHLAASFKQAILDLKDPLLVLVDRDNTEQLLAEQQRQMTGVFDESYGVEAGKLIGARYVLTAKLLRYDEILRRDIELQVQLLDAQSGRIYLSEIVSVNRNEIGRGNTRSQLMERAAKRMAARMAAFDPHKR